MPASVESRVEEGLRRKTESLGKKNAYHCAGNCCYCSQAAAAHDWSVDCRETWFKSERLMADDQAALASDSLGFKKPGDAEGANPGAKKHGGTGFEPEISKPARWKK